jgi:predicted TPR repeat methyltransferase
LGNAEAALKDAEVATELDPQYARAYMRRAAAHQALEHFEEAVRDYEQVRCSRSVRMHMLMLSMLCLVHGQMQNHAQLYSECFVAEHVIVWQGLQIMKLDIVVMQHADTAVYSVWVLHLTVLAQLIHMA